MTAAWVGRPRSFRRGQKSSSDQICKLLKTGLPSVFSVGVCYRLYATGNAAAMASKPRILRPNLPILLRVLRVLADFPGGEFEQIAGDFFDHST